MNEIVNMFLLAGGKILTEMRLRQLGFTYNPCGLFTIKKEYQNSKKMRFMIYSSKRTR